MLPESFFVSSKIHTKEVELADGEKHTLYFKEVSAVDYAKFYTAYSSSEPDVQVTAGAIMISAGLCNEDGSSAITYEEALKLKAQPANAIFNALMEVNKVEGKASTPKSGSGIP